MNSDVTIALTAVDKDKGFGIWPWPRVDDNGDIISFVEKPEDPSLIETFYVPPFSQTGRRVGVRIKTMCWRIWVSMCFQKIIYAH